MRILCIFLMAFCALPSLAKEKDHVLDFEGEIIEGERKRPDLFLQMTTTELNNGDLIYVRENFNDFLEVDKKIRPQYFQVKK